MRGMNFDEARGSASRRAFRRFTESANNFADPFDGERDWHGIVGGKGDGARRDDVAPAAVVWRELARAIPGTGRACLAAGMRKLDAGYAPLGVNKFRNSRQSLDVGFAPKSQVLRGGLMRASGRTSGGLGHNQCRSADCAGASEMNEMPIESGQPVFAGVLAHGDGI